MLCGVGCLVVCWKSLYQVLLLPCIAGHRLVLVHLGNESLFLALNWYQKNCAGFPAANAKNIVGVIFAVEGLYFSWLFHVTELQKLEIEVLKTIVSHRNKDEGFFSRVTRSLVSSTSCRPFLLRHLNSVVYIIIR